MKMKPDNDVQAADQASGDALNVKRGSGPLRISPRRAELYQRSLIMTHLTAFLCPLARRGSRKHDEHEDGENDHGS